MAILTALIFWFHQSNKFMLQKLAERAGIPFKKLPMNLVEKYGNPRGASIPLVAIENPQDKPVTDNFKCCLSAFGSGLAWDAIIMKIGNSEHCELIVSNL